MPDPSVVNEQAWNAYFKGVRDQMVGSWNRLRDAYLTHQRIRAQLGLQAVMAPGEKFDPGAISEETEQDVLHLQASTILLSKFMDEVVAGTRKISFDKTKNDFFIERLPNDTITVQLNSRGAPRVVELDSSSEVSVDGTVGNPWAAAVIAVVAGLTIYFTTAKVEDTIKSNVEQATMATISTNQTKQIELGATPEEVKANTDAVFEGAKQLERAKGESKQKEGETGIQSTIRTVAWVGLGIAVVALLAKVAPVVVAKEAA